MLLDDETLFYAAQERLKENKRFARRNNNVNQYLLRGMLKCGECGNNMTGTPAPQGSYCYYRCSKKLWRKSNGGQDYCGAPLLRADKADAAMWKEIKGKLLDWENLVKGLRKQKEEMEKAINPLTEQLEWVESRLAETKTELDKALRLHLADNLARESLDRIIAERRQEREGLERTRANLLGRIEAGKISDEDIQTVKDFAKKIAQGLENADFESKRRLFEILQVQGRVIQTDDGQQIKGSWLIPKRDLIVDVSSVPSITARL